MESNLAKNQEWLPLDNDTKAVLAAAYSHFYKGAEIEVIPSEFPVDTPYEPLPPTVNVLGILDIFNVNPDQAKRIHNFIHSPKRAAGRWGDFTRPSVLGYRWANLFTFRVDLAKHKDEVGQRAMFPILYSDTSDVDLILLYAKNQFHQSAYAALGLEQSQMLLCTYIYSDGIGWYLRE